MDFGTDDFTEPYTFATPDTYPDGADSLVGAVVSIVPDLSIWKDKGFVSKCTVNISRQ